MRTEKKRETADIRKALDGAGKRRSRPEIFWPKKKEKSGQAEPGVILNANEILNHLGITKLKPKSGKEKDLCGSGNGPLFLFAGNRGLFQRVWHRKRLGRDRMTVYTLNGSERESDMKNVGIILNRQTWFRFGAACGLMVGENFAV